MCIYVTFNIFNLSAPRYRKLLRQEHRNIEQYQWQQRQRAHINPFQSVKYVHG